MIVFDRTIDKFHCYSSSVSHDFSRGFSWGDCTLNTDTDADAGVSVMNEYGEAMSINNRIT